MTCIKTGADVYIAEHGATLHGDLFQVGETYILALGGAISQCWNHAPTHSHITAYCYYECGSRAIAFTTASASDFFYDGHPCPTRNAI